MRRAPVLALAAVLAASTASAASAATDTVLATATVGGLSITGGVVPTASVSTAIGSTSSEIAGGAMTVTDTRGIAGGWQVTAQYVAPLTSTLLGGLTTAVQALPASAVQVKTAEVSSTALAGSRSYTSGSFVTLPDSGAVNVASANTATTGGLTVFSTAYKITIPANATLGTVYGAGVEYTVSPPTP